MGHASAGLRDRGLWPGRTGFSYPAQHGEDGVRDRPPEPGRLHREDGLLHRSLVLAGRFQAVYVRAIEGAGGYAGLGPVAGGNRPLSTADAQQRITRAARIPGADLRALLDL